MKQGYMSAGVVCPFYKCENRQHIACRDDSGNHLHITFSEAHMKQDFKKRCCCDPFGQKNCPLYRGFTMLEEQ